MGFFFFFFCRRVPIVLFFLGCSLADFHSFSLPLEYFKWLFNRKPYFLSVTRDHFLIMHKLETAKRITLVCSLVGGLEYYFIFQLNEPQSQTWIKLNLRGKKKKQVDYNSMYQMCFIKK